MKLPKKIEVVEVGPRDGFQNLSNWIPTEIKLDIIRKLANAGIRKMEVTSFVHPKAIPQMSDAQDIAETIVSEGANRNLTPIALVPNLYGARKAYSSGINEVTYVISASEKHNLENINRTVEQSLSELAKIKMELPELKVRLDVATSFGCPFLGEVDSELVLNLIERAIEYDISSAILCDTIGVANPYQVFNLARLVSKNFPDISLGLHLHDTQGMGLANYFAGMEAGVTIFETSIGGLGGCPFAPGASGNTATEDLVNMLHGMDVETGIELVKIIEVAQTIKESIDAPTTGRISQLKRICNCA